MRFPTSFQQRKDLIQRALMRLQTLSRAHPQRVFDKTHIHSRIVCRSPHWSRIGRTNVTSLELIDEFLFG
jgi:hypothetical protein